MNRTKHSIGTSSGGFTLVEIMIVVAIIALLAAIAIPNLLRARHNANETAAIAMLRTISSSQESFRAAQTPPIYAALGPNATGGTLTGSTPPYLNATATATTITRQGYVHTQAGFDANTFCVSAAPVTAGTTGTRVFAVDGSGVVRGTSGGVNPVCSGATPWAASLGAGVE